MVRRSLGPEQPPQLRGLARFGNVILLGIYWPREFAYFERAYQLPQMALEFVLRVDLSAGARRLLGNQHDHARADAGVHLLTTTDCFFALAPITILGLASGDFPWSRFTDRKWRLAASTARRSSSSSP
ncbi:MAG: hypothetical protein R3E12_01345 [Candidatus Eisenbacteria bacterium]